MIEPRPEPRGTKRRDAAIAKGIERRASVLFPELDGHRLATKSAIVREDVTMRLKKETKRDRERREARERKIKTGVIR